MMCARWHELMADASMWPIVDVMPRGYGVCCPSIHFDITNMDVWLRHSGAGLRELTLRASVQCCHSQCAN